MTSRRVWSVSGAERNYFLLNSYIQIINLMQPTTQSISSENIIRNSFHYDGKISQYYINIFRTSVVSSIFSFTHSIPRSVDLLQPSKPHCVIDVQHDLLPEGIHQGVHDAPDGRSRCGLHRYVRYLRQIKTLKLFTRQEGTAGVRDTDVGLLPDQCDGRKRGGDQNCVQEEHWVPHIWNLPATDCAPSCGILDLLLWADRLYRESSNIYWIDFIISDAGPGHGLPYLDVGHRNDSLQYPDDAARHSLPQADWYLVSLSISVQVCWPHLLYRLLFCTNMMVFSLIFHTYVETIIKPESHKDPADLDGIFFTSRKNSKWDNAPARWGLLNRDTLSTPNYYFRPKSSKERNKIDTEKHGDKHIKDKQMEKAEKFNRYGKIGYVLVMAIFYLGFWIVAFWEFMRPAEEYINRGLRR